jgi:hypothetical protein
MYCAALASILICALHFMGWRDFSLYEGGALLLLGYFWLANYFFCR